MALTEKYVTQDSDGGDGSEGNPWTLTEAMANATAGQRVNIKYSSSAYELSTTTMPSGTAVDPIVFRGYHTSIGDLDNRGRNSSGLVDCNATSYEFPDITITGLWTFGAFNVLQNLDITGALSSALIGSTANDGQTILNCNIVNTQNNSGARCIQGDDRLNLIDSDFYCSGAAHASVVDSDGGTYAAGCRFRSTSSSALLALNVGTVSDSVFYGNSSSPGVDFQAPLLTNNLAAVENCTFYGIGSAVRTSNDDQTQMVVLRNNHITDCAKVLDNQYSSNEAFCIMVHNRTRDNGASTDYVEAANKGAVTTDTGDYSTDYVAAGSGDFRLISTAPGKSAGSMPYQDIGALQRAEPSVPSTGDVQDGVTYGDGGTQYTGTFIVPAESTVLDNTEYGNSAEYTGTVVLPNEEDVEESVTYGASSGKTGTFAVPAEEDVEDGVFYGGDGTEFEGTLVGGAGGGGASVMGGTVVK